jgi:hypothetical protein
MIMDGYLALPDPACKRLQKAADARAPGISKRLTIAARCR